ncbi:zinc-binding dehydrogenase [Rhizobium mayense]|uniref:Zinc-binding dehydrogenase n=1 Tax=Rhizobium mayense TaxID=1312184 RepID=A0ABT7JPD4_9HYPH|nr:zinc-binding dehydrogenase [Rhizobium mayense]MDL2398211.1 zinc-binding dehydrogenase [Rhizobium mayense]
MKTIRFKGYGGPDVLDIVHQPDPEPAEGTIVIAVRAFGLNRAETYMRSGRWGEVAKITGIECVGEILNDPSGRYEIGTKVTALMGGMGRSINGSYAEQTRVPMANVVPISSRLSWADLAAIPESYATAWTCLHRNLGIAEGQTLLIRGATSALGQAAINIAVAAGAIVIATTRRPERLSRLRDLGAHEAVLDEPSLSETIRGRYSSGLDAVLDIVGTSTLLDSLKMARRGGHLCMAGFLGGGSGIAVFDPLSHMPSGVQLSFFASFMFGTPGFELDDVPLQAIVERVEAGIYNAKPARTFGFHDIREAHRLMESDGAMGKLVVVV